MLCTQYLGKIRVRRRAEVRRVQQAGSGFSAAFETRGRSVNSATARARRSQCEHHLELESDSSARHGPDGRFSFLEFAACH